MQRKYLYVLLFSLLINPVFAKEMNSDVVVIVDTSISMKNKRMDPNRASLLVSKLLSDVIPEGRLSYIRLLDLAKDSALLPSKETGEKIACGEDERAICNRVEADIEEWIRLSNEKGYGLLERSKRGSDVFKEKLDSHLEQSSNNSLFYLSFSAARGWLNKGSKENNKYVIWLSDGKAEQRYGFLEQVSLTQKADIDISAVIFGAGDDSLAKEAKISDIQKVHKPIDLMKAFADMFRKIVNAPYDIDNTIASSPEFEVLKNMKEVWVVVYGDDSLSDVSLVKPNGSIIRADYAKDIQKNAGAYQVAYIENPEEGKWRVNVKGGGSDVAYAVVQNSSMYPYLEKPSKAYLGMKTKLVASIKAGGISDRVTAKELLGRSTLSANIDGKKYNLNDKGIDGDDLAGDGLYSGFVTFSKKGRNDVLLNLKSPFVNKAKKYSIDADGSFTSDGNKQKIDFGFLKNGDEACRSVILKGKQQGVVLFELDVLKRLPSGHELIAKSNDNKGLNLTPNEAFSICLKVDKRAPTSIYKEDPLLAIKVMGSSKSDQAVIFDVSWKVDGLSFLERWWWLLFLILVIILLAILILGYILPQRFQSTLHISMGADEAELEEFVPMQLKRMPKVGIGFYRNARAYIFDDFRVSGKGRGASIKITAHKNSNIIIEAINGRVLQKKNIHQEWESIDSEGILRTGEILRVGSGGLYFKLLDK